MQLLTLFNPWVLFGIGIFILLFIGLLVFALPYLIGGILIVGAFVVMVILANNNALNQNMLIILGVVALVGVLSIALPHIWGAFQTLTVVDLIQG